MSYPGATSTKSAFWSECLISFRLILYLFFVAIYFIYGMKKRKRRKKNSTNQIATTNMNNNSESRNPRRPPEESGPFGRRRNARYDHARSRTRTGTPAKRENPNVAEFTRLFSQQQEKTAQQAKPSTTKTSSTGVDGNDGGEKVATECVLFGYRSKDSEWKVIDKFEKISQGFICEDYPRSDPSLTSRYSELLSGGDVVIRANLTADANRKSKRFAGGFHWIKVTFDSRAAADRAIYYAPQDIEGYHVFCRLYDGHGPQEDVPLPVDSEPATMALELHARDQHRPLNVPVVATPIIPDLLEPTPRKTPRGKQQQFVTGNLIDLDVGEDEEDISDLSTATASSATATEMEQLNRPFPALLPTNTIKTPSPSTTTATVSSSASTSTSFSPNTLRQRHFSTSQTRRKSQPQPQPQPPQNQTPQQHSEYMSHLPAVRKAELRPMTEALPPQPTVVERVLRSIPILSWFTGDIVGDGPQLREDGSFDYERSNVYWRFWYAVDRFVGTDVCGLKEEVY